MKGPATLFLALTALLGSLAGVSANSYPRLAADHLLVVRTTAYNHREADHIRFGSKNALGGTLKVSGEEREVVQNASGSITTFEAPVGSAAADWSRFPAGTQFKVISTGEVYEVDDYGIALTGTATIDLYKPTMQAMDDWGVRHERIRIIKVGSFAASYAHLAKCPDLPYIKAMREETRRRALEEARQPQLVAMRDTSALDSGSSTSGSSEARTTRRPAPLPKDAYTRNKPAAPGSSAWKRNKPR